MRMAWEMQGLQLRKDALLDLLGFCTCFYPCSLLVVELVFVLIDALVLVLIQVLCYVLIKALVCVPFRPHFQPVKQP